jgi:hypothetical protein
LSQCGKSGNTKGDGEEHLVFTKTS